MSPVLDIATKGAAESLHHSPEPLEALFASWRPALFRYALRLCGAPDLAEDFVQEAFLALCRKSVEGEDVRDPRQWTLCVVRYQASKHLRDQSRRKEEFRPTELLDNVAASVPSSTPSGGGGQVNALLHVLTPREREVFRLRMESMKYEQIALRLRISPKTIAALLARALRKLQKAAAA
jgi:RNA polymerase sigma factor (sigma-70 family)